MEHNWEDMIEELSKGDIVLAYERNILSNSRAYKVKFIDAVPWTDASQEDLMHWEVACRQNKEEWPTDTPCIIHGEVIGNEGAFIEKFGLTVDGTWRSLGELNIGTNGDMHNNLWAPYHGVLDLDETINDMLWQHEKKNAIDFRKKIICLVGPSGAGKTCGSLVVACNLGLQVLCSYTTRPMRGDEVDGIDHWFKKECGISHDEMLAYTKYCNYEYWVPLADLTISERDTFLYVIDENGLTDLKKRFGDQFNIKSIYITRDDLNSISDDRRDRDKKRSKLPLSSYDACVENNGSLSHFYYALTSCIARLMGDI